MSSTNWTNIWCEHGRNAHQLAIEVTMYRRNDTNALAIWVVTTAVVAAGCTEPNPAYDPGADLPDECRSGEETTEVFEHFERPDAVDLWFVVSDVDGMAGHQGALSRAVEPFLLQLAEDELDVQAAVSTMDMSAGPSLAPVVDDREGCTENDRQIAHSDDGDWIDTVRCNLRQGDDGDRRPRPFDVTAGLVVDDPASLDDFRRDHARLVVVMLTNQDDCSGPTWDDDPETPARFLCAWQSDDLRDVESWIDQMRQSAVVDEGFSLAAIAGPPTEVVYEQGESVLPVCSSTLGNSYPSPRLSAATRGLGDQGLFASSCVFDYFDNLDQIARQLVMRDTVTLCTAEPMVHEPLQVVGTYEDGERPVGFGTGFVYTGSTDACPQGGLELRRQGAQSLQRMEVTYCTP